MQALYRNHMGNDLEVVRDARISFDSSSDALEWRNQTIPHTEPGYTDQVPVPVLAGRDYKLIRFLARGCRFEQWDQAVTALQGGDLAPGEIDTLLRWVKRMPTYWTPFAHQMVKLRMKAPIPIRTQCFKSKQGFVENEESRRYIDSTPELFVPEFRVRPEGSIKQGSGGIHPDNAYWQGRYRAGCDIAIHEYERMIQEGIAPEQARFVLPQGVYVNWVWTGSLYAYAEFCNKRSDRGHAQGEIADLAQEIDQILRVLYPASWKALTE
ncbi:FAD-dependent thymidylate synthase [Larsenimonas suaedae]|uniref:FAD-dependent thymidylate synthase n=1 Tax=Larsenimonas suaedae TaxID=1851019 RepID=A0ABU1GZ48_9GAMM|nr:FAD-dependent thymidylate synthase [Larsenimonas suaedae]MCM2973795.1 FAD-dependent thymidylate synthase [Larsenimonas suaedae]MDR5897319.1 FAD-dependent thymidylate synthase [Larsenimonas suaedae]